MQIETQFSQQYIYLQKVNYLCKNLNIRFHTHLSTNETLEQMVETTVTKKKTNLSQMASMSSNNQYLVRMVKNQWVCFCEIEKFETQSIISETQRRMNMIIKDINSNSREYCIVGKQRRKKIDRLVKIHYKMQTLFNF